ncbi:MAG: hypothetical protein ACC646_10455 [Paracoccaceae bacterium]
MAFQLERGDDFAIDKPAAQPCVHLDAGHRCVIHDRLAARGFRGCVRFSCNGAGQRVTQEVFAGVSWRDQPELTGAMIRAFGAMRQVHEQLVLLRAASGLPLCAADRQALVALEQDLSPPGGWSKTRLAAFEKSDTVARVAAFLQGLRGYVVDRPAS